MKFFVDILKQFTSSQRLIVLILLLSFTTGSYLLSQYFKTDDCKFLIDENLKMHEDFAKISSMLRAERIKSEKIVLDTLSTYGVVQIEDNLLMDSILNIAEANNK